MARSVASCDANAQRKKSKQLDIRSLDDDFATDLPRCVGAMPYHRKISRRERRCNWRRRRYFDPGGVKLAAIHANTRMIPRQSFSAPAASRRHHG
jgi:hypothetical protein